MLVRIWSRMGRGCGSRSGFGHDREQPQVAELVTDLVGLRTWTIVNGPDRPIFSSGTMVASGGDDDGGFSGDDDEGGQPRLVDL